jgi:hypothetical protein
MHLLVVAIAFVLHLLNAPTPAAGHGTSPHAVIEGGSTIDPAG